MIRSNPKVDLVNINAYTKFGEIISICSEDIERKPNYDGQNDGQTDRWNDGRNDRQPKSSLAPLFQSRAIKTLSSYLRDN